MSAALASLLKLNARRIVERDCHVSASVRAAVYHVITRLKDGRATYWRFSRDERRALWRGAREGIKGNRELYYIATRGTAGQCYQRPVLTIGVKGGA